MHPDCGLRTLSQLEPVRPKDGSCSSPQAKGMVIVTRSPEGLASANSRRLYTYVDEFAFNNVDDRNNIIGPALVTQHKASRRMTYNVNDWQFSWNVDYADEMNDPYFGAPLDAVYYHDATVRWFPNDTYEASFIISNVTDEQPPTFLASAFASWGQSNTVPAYYDPLGRYYRFGLKAKF